MAERLAFQVRPRGGHPAHQRAPPYPEQHTEELGDDVVARINPLTGGIENLEVLFFSARLERGQPFELPVDADLRRSR